MVFSPGQLMTSIPHAVLDGFLLMLLCEQQPRTTSTETLGYGCHMVTIMTTATIEGSDEATYCSQCPCLLALQALFFSFPVSLA